MSRFAEVVFPRPFIHGFTYLLPEIFPPLAKGQRVLAPLGRQTAAGFVVRVHDEPPTEGLALKTLLAVLDPAPLIPAAVIEFTRRLAAYHVSSWGEMLEAGLPPAEPEPPTRKARASRPASAASPAPRQLAFDFAATPAVADAARAVDGAVESGRFAPFYASGGAEERRALYRRLVQAALARSRSVLILVPEVDEIAGVQAWASEAARSPAVAVHGQLSARARGAARSSIQAGRAAAVIGARTALFWPIPRLGLIIVEDEPHEAYLQMESPAFDVRRGARLRAEEEGAAFVLGAENPSVEAMSKARENHYLFELGNSARRPRVLVADDGASRELLTPALTDGLRTVLAGRGRAIVFINRRGYASFVFCPSCGFIPACRRCGGRPAYHKKEDRLVCHVCGATAPRPSQCPRCGQRILEPRGIGVEAVEEEIRRLFPRVRIARFDRDLAGRAAVQAKILGRYASGKVDILIGTELLARRAAVPPADFVGIVNPEAWLAFPDFTASERAFQAVSRMLRLARPSGRDVDAVVQTGFPDHYSLREAARQDYGAFFAAEVEARRLLRYPPFSAMAEVVLSGRDPRSLGRKARTLAARLGRGGRDLEIAGPAMAATPGGGGLKKVQLVLRAADPEAITNALNEGLREMSGGWRVTRFG
jgi:primosomal protein N' (replication factor Y)